MRVLEKIVIQDFRNIVLQELTFSKGINCITGSNGEGKTNLLDAVYYLSMTKSAFNPADRFIFRHGTKSFALSGTYSLDSLKTKICIKADSALEKRVLRDDKQYQRLADHIGLIPVVMVSPGDSALVTDSADERRRFVNAVLSQMDAEYLSTIQRYNRLLAQRNALLKSGTPQNDLIDAIDAQMEPLAQAIYCSRAEFTAQLEPKVGEFYGKISGGSEHAGIRYRSDLSARSFTELMGRNRERDLSLQYTTAGVQKDDFIFTMDSEPIRNTGSQGQQKSFLVALKFAQFDIMSASYGFPPILLLDDLFDKLDKQRTRHLLETVAGQGFGQIFITDTDEQRIREAAGCIGGECAFYRAEAGSYASV